MEPKHDGFCQCLYCMIKKYDEVVSENDLLRGANIHLSSLLTEKDFSLITVEEYNNMCKELKTLRQHNRELKSFLVEVGKRVGGNTETLISTFLETGDFGDK